MAKCTTRYGVIVDDKVSKGIGKAERSLDPIVTADKPLTVRSLAQILYRAARLFCTLLEKELK